MRRMPGRVNGTISDANLDSLGALFAIPPHILVPGQLQRRGDDCGCKRLLRAILVDAFLSLTRPLPGRSDLDVVAETLRWFEVPHSGMVSLAGCEKSSHTSYPTPQTVDTALRSAPPIKPPESLTQRLEQTQLTDMPALW